MAVDARARYEQLVAEIQHEFPRFRLIRKDRSPLSRWIHRALVVLTFGQMRDYLGSYHTTLGARVYVTPDWDQKDFTRRYVTLRHERIHLRQFRRYGLVGMALLYLLVPLPLGAAYFRARLEQEAYADTLRASAEVYGLEHILAPAFRAHIVGQFLGPSYGWMWPFRRSVESWYDCQVERLRAEGVGD